MTRTLTVKKDTFFKLDSAKQAKYLPPASKYKALSRASFPYTFVDTELHNGHYKISFQSSLNNGFNNVFTWYVYHEDVVLGDSCAQVAASEGLKVREFPLKTAKVIKSLDHKTPVRLVGQTKETSDGYKWEQISSPEFGWIAASHHGNRNISDSPCPMPTIG